MSTKCHTKPFTYTDEAVVNPCFVCVEGETVTIYRKVYTHDQLLKMSVRSLRKLICVGLHEILEDLDLDADDEKTFIRLPRPRGYSPPTTPNMGPGWSRPNAMASSN